MTNAAKYGSLSAESGRISVGWELLDFEGDRRLTLQWIEMDGPPVKAPERTGFGTRLIRTVASGLGGKANLLFESSGLQLRVSIPLRN
jgi:two-component sensor histidine kinase